MLLDAVGNQRDQNHGDKEAERNESCRTEDKAKTTAAVARFMEDGNSFLMVLTDPTTGGVSASFAFQADVIVAESKAMIGFAGRRVIEQTIRQRLPDQFQTAEFLLEKGAIDMVVDRRNLKDTLVRLLEYVNHQQRAASVS